MWIFDFKNSHLRHVFNYVSPFPAKISNACRQWFTRKRCQTESLQKCTAAICYVIFTASHKQLNIRFPNVAFSYKFASPPCCYYWFYWIKSRGVLLSSNYAILIFRENRSFSEAEAGGTQTHVHEHTHTSTHTDSMVIFPFAFASFRKKVAHKLCRGCWKSRRFSPLTRH